MNRCAIALAALAVLLLGCEEPVSPPIEPPPAPGVGAIAVTSTPSGARVFLDGSDTGRITPHTIRGVSHGTHTIRLTLEGYEDWGPEDVEVAADRTAPVDATLTAHEPEPTPEYGLGLIPTDAQAYRNAQILRAEPVAFLPASVDLSADIPRPGNQGPQGSCVGWAVAYALKTYQERVERSWPLNDHRHIMSPAYIYNQAKEPGGGTYFQNAFDLLMTQGVSSWALMPYDKLDDDTLPSLAAIEEAANYRIAEWGTVLHPTHAEFVPEIKRHLAAGAPVVIGIWVNQDFDSLSESNPVYNYHDGCQWPQDRCRSHAITLVGYDDRLSALKFINSWGTNWGVGGYGWIDYDYASTLIWEAYVTRDIVASSDPDPPVAASDPSPQDGTVNVATDTTLSWTRNARTTAFDVYLGLRSTLTATDLQSTVAQPTFSSSLAMGTTYYWRVDARGVGGTTAGPVWSFTTVNPAPPPLEPPTIVRALDPLMFASPDSNSRTILLTSYVIGAAEYDVEIAPRSVATAAVTGHALTISPQGAGTAGLALTARNAGGTRSLETEVTVNAPAPTIIRWPGTLRFSSPDAAAQTLQLDQLIQGATSYTVQTIPAGIVTKSVVDHRLTVTPAAAGRTTVHIQGTNKYGSSPWLKMSATVTASRPPPEPPVIIGYPSAIVFASPNVAGRTLMMNRYIRGATNYNVDVTPGGIVVAAYARGSHHLTINPHTAGTADVSFRGINEDGSSSWVTVIVTVTAAQPPDPPLVNQPPVTRGIPDQLLEAGSTRTLTLSRYFLDPEGDALTYAARSDQARIARVSEPDAASRITVTAVSAGHATITVTATDPGGLSGSDSFTVEVSAPAVTFGSQTIPDITTSVDVIPDKVMVNLPLAHGGSDLSDFAYLIRRAGSRKGQQFPPGFHIGRFTSGYHFLQGTATVAHGPTQYAWVLTRINDPQLAALAQIVFTITVSEGRYPIPSFDQHPRTYTRHLTLSISNEAGGGQSFFVSLPPHLGGMEPFTYTLDPLIPGCKELKYGSYVNELIPNGFRCSTNQLILGTWTTTYTVTDADGDSDAVELTYTFVP